MVQSLLESLLRHCCQPSHSKAFSQYQVQQCLIGVNYERARAVTQRIESPLRRPLHRRCSMSSTCGNCLPIPNAHTRIVGQNYTDVLPHIHAIVSAPECRTQSATACIDMQTYKLEVLGWFPVVSDQVPLCPCDRDVGCCQLKTIRLGGSTHKTSHASLLVDVVVSDTRLTEKLTHFCPQSVHPQCHLFLKLASPVQGQQFVRQLHREIHTLVAQATLLHQHSDSCQLASPRSKQLC